LLIRDSITNNIFNALGDYFHFFIQSHILGLNPDQIQIILVDNYDENRFLSEIWGILGNDHILRKKNIIESKVLLKRAFFLTNSLCSITRNVDIINHCYNYGYWVKQFVNTVISRFNFPTTNHSKPIITIISRNDKRRIHNEVELVDNIKKRNYGVEINLVSLENYIFISQVDIVRNSDIIIGMHGAELTTAVFMPKGKVLVELFPYGFDCREYNCYSYHNLAAQVGLTYLSWFNNMKENNFEQKGDKFDANTKIETEDFIKIVNNALRTLGYNITL